MRARLTRRDNAAATAVAIAARKIGEDRRVVAKSELELDVGVICAAAAVYPTSTDV